MIFRYKVYREKILASPQNSEDSMYNLNWTMASADNDEQIIAWLSWYNLRTYIRAEQVQSILQT